jgi:PAT family beta-lactamase induction signal transducer AmpG
VFNEVWFSRGMSFALLMILILLAVFRRPLAARLTRNPDSFYGRSFLSFMDQPKIGLLLAFIVLVRAGEFMLTSMVPPFMVDLGIKIHYGWISGGVSLPCSILGAMLGGWMISRHGMKKTIWPFLVAQNLTNLIYMALAFSMSGYLAANAGATHPIPLPLLRLAAVAGVHGFDQFASGLGSAVLITLIMRLCRAEYKAAHFAIGSGLMSLSGVFAGIAGGLLASWLGYGAFFGISFLFSLPGMALIHFIPKE